MKGKGISLKVTPDYYFHPLHRHLDISLAITADSLPLHIASSLTQTGNLTYTYVILVYVYIAYIYTFTYMYIYTFIYIYIYIYSMNIYIIYNIYEYYLHC